MIPLSPILENPVRELYIMGGQSNRVGFALPMVSKENFKKYYRCFNYAHDGAWKPLDNPVHSYDDVQYPVFVSASGIARFSSELSFATELARLRSGVEIGVIPCAKGGSGMNDWARNLSTSSLYGAMLARINAALEHENSVLKGIVWYQGEEDAKTSSNAYAWRSRYEQLISDLRDDLGVTLPAVHTKLAPTTQTTERPYWSVVKAQQAAVDIENSAMVDAGDLNLYDSIHIDTQGQIITGVRSAQAINGIL